MYFGVNVVRFTLDSQYNMQSYCGHCHSCTRYYTIPELLVDTAKVYCRYRHRKKRLISPAICYTHVSTRAIWYTHMCTHAWPGALNRASTYTAVTTAVQGFGRCALPRAAPTSEAESACGLWLRRAQCMNISNRQNGPIVLVSPR